MCTKSQATFTQANSLLRIKDYDGALTVYEILLEQYTEEPLKNNVRFNYELAKRRIRDVSLTRNYHINAEDDLTKNNEDFTDVFIIKNSQLFDSNYYIKNNNDVFESNIDPAWHYINFGANEGRDPSAFFSTKYYIFMHDDVRCAGINPLLHYLQFGKSEGRDISSAGWKEPDLSLVTEPITKTSSWYEVNQLTPNRIRALNHGLSLIGIEKPLIKYNSLSALESEFIIAATEADVISFDIFDTLLVRNFMEPVDIFHILEREIKSKGIYSGNFAQLRIQAEHLARQNSKHEEVNLLEIYKEWAVLAGVADDVSKLISQLEIEIELDNIRPRDFGIRLFDQAKSIGKEINLISDFYMPLDIVVCMLKKANLTGYKHVLISSDYRLTKHFGGIYKKYKSLLKIDSKLLHVGDNMHSDGVMAINNGLKSILIKKNYDHNEVNKTLSYLWGADYSNYRISNKLANSAIFSIITRKIDALVDEYSQASKGYAEDPYLLGYTAFGPMFAGMAAYVARIAKQRGYEKLFFASRDGYHIMAAYDCLARKDPTLPPSQYFFSSRKLANLSSIQDEVDIVRVAEIDFTPCRLKDLLINRFDLKLEDLESLSRDSMNECGFSSIDDLVEQDKHQSGLVRIAKLLGERIIELNKTKRDLYTNYLQKIGFNSPNTAMVDIGYSGTIQLAVSNLLGSRIGGIYFITWKRAAKIEKAGLASDCFLGNQVEQEHPFNRYIQLFELIFSATHPSIVGVEKGLNDEFRPIYSGKIFPQKTIALLSEIHRGAMDFVEEFSKSFLWNNDVYTELDASDYTAPTFSIFKNPTPAVARLFKDITFEDDFGGSRQKLIDKFGPAQPLDVNDIIRKSLWKEGAKALVHSSEAGADWSISNKLERTHFDHGQFYWRVDDFDKYGLIPSYYISNPTKEKLGYTKEAIRFLVVLKTEAAHIDNINKFIHSLSIQNYDQWTLVVLVDNISIEVLKIISDWQAKLPKNVISISASKTSVRSVIEETNEINWLIFSTDRSRLSEQYLAEILLEACNEPADLIYTDHSVIHCNGDEDTLVFKPSWSPELLRNQQYIGATYAISKQLAFLSGCSIDTAPSLAHLLSLIKISPVVRHLPKVLWMETQGGNNHPNESVEDIKALESSYHDEGINCSINEYWITKNIKCYRPQFDDIGPSVAIIIPTKNSLNVLTKCIESIDKTTYQNYKVYIIDNDSDDLSTIEYLAMTKHNVLRISSQDSGFNYSYINNQAVKLVTEDYLLFLNNDTEVITPDWLSQMVGWARLQGVGSVGARLLYENGKVQHAGLINGLLYGILPAPAFKLLDREDPGYLGHAKLTKNYSAVTAACMLTPRHLFLELKGFNETEFGVAYNDCDYGFRLTIAGYRNVYCAEAELFHYEGYTRGIGIGNDKPSEEAEFVKAYGNWQDPFYNPNLELDRTDFGIASRTIGYKHIPRIRVLFITHNLNHEGAPIILCEIASGIARSQDFEVVILSPKDGPLRKRYEEIGIQVHILKNLPIFGAKESSTYNAAIQTIKNIIEELNVELVFANTVLTWWAIDAATDAKLPSIWIIHESESPFSQFDEHSAFLKRNASRCINYPYQVVFVANATKKLFEPLAVRHNITVIHNGFDPTRLSLQVVDMTKQSVRRRLNIEEKEIVILAVGTVCERKNQIELISALKLLSNDILKNIKVIIVGDRPSAYSQLLHKKIAELPIDLSKCVTLVPETGDVGQYYLAADIFIMTSKLESFPVVIQEAMYFGLPIIAHPSFGIREQVVNESTALFYTLGDNNNLAETIKRLIKSEILRGKLSTNAKISLSKLPSNDDMVAKYSQLIKEAWIFGSPRLNYI